MAEEVKCVFCGDDVVEMMAMREDNLIIKGSAGAVHNGHGYPLCSECHKLWTDLIGCLVSKFVVEGKESLKKVLAV